jgi:hypothetical protein
MTVTARAGHLGVESVDARAWRLARPGRTFLGPGNRTFLGPENRRREDTSWAKPSLPLLA